MTRSIVSAFHRYQPYGEDFYEPIYNSFIERMGKYKDEFDKLYLIDSTWGITNPPPFAEVIKVNSSLRYYDAYKEVLPQIKEDLVLFMDNDQIIYKENIIKNTFNNLEWNDVISILDTCGTYTTDKLFGFNKLCPYWIASKKEIFMRYLDVDWAPHMPYSETLGLLTEKMINDGLSIDGMADDKNSIYYDGAQDGDKGKDLGYYHIRAGSTPAYLLSEKKYGNPQTYWDYIMKQPKREYIRQTAWYKYMGGNPKDLINDSGVFVYFDEYYQKFLEYHNL